MENSQILQERIGLEVKKLIAKVTDRKPEEVSETMSLAGDLGLDSLLAIEVMVSLDTKFSIDIPEEECVKVDTVHQLVALVLSRLSQPATVRASV